MKNTDFPQKLTLHPLILTVFFAFMCCYAPDLNCHPLEQLEQIDSENKTCTSFTKSKKSEQESDHEQKPSLFDKLFAGKGEDAKPDQPPLPTELIIAIIETAVNCNYIRPSDALSISWITRQNLQSHLSKVITPDTDTSILQSPTFPFAFFRAIHVRGDINTLDINHPFRCINLTGANSFQFEDIQHIIRPLYIGLFAEISASGTDLFKILTIEYGCSTTPKARQALIEFKLSRMLYHGLGVAQDLNKARALYESISHNPHLRPAFQREARFRIAKMQFSGDGADKDIPAARQAFKVLKDDKALISNLRIPAKYHFAKMLLNGVGGPRDFMQGREVLKSLLEDNRASLPAVILAELSFDYAVMLHSGIGGRQELPKALRLFHDLKINRYLPSLYRAKSAFNYCQILLNNCTKPGRYHETRPLLETLMKDPHLSINDRLEAGYAYARLLFHGHGGPQDLDEARSLLHDIAYCQHVTLPLCIESAFPLACMLLKGQGGPVDYARAFHLFNFLVNHPPANPECSSTAQFHYAHMLYEGWGCEKDPILAKQYFEFLQLDVNLPMNLRMKASKLYQTIKFPNTDAS